MGNHWELIRFIVVPKMIESLILGLAWLDKWGPTIWWSGGFRRLRISNGPDPPLHEQARGGGEENQDQGHTFPPEYNDLKEVFSETECEVLPPHRPTDCAIELVPGVKLPKPRMYSMTPAEMQEMRKYIDKNLARGFIKPSRSRIAAPVLFREKKDGSLRLCVDFRGLNGVCVEHLYPLPLMKDMLATLAKGKYFTRLDLREAYYRVRIRQGDEWKTTFNCPLGSYQFQVMPFGLQGAPAVFMQLINEVLHEHLYRGVLVYLDDILIYTATMEEHVRLVRQVLKKLLEAKLYVKLSKCDFHQTTLDYLGYRISSSGVEMDPNKVKAVLEWQAPKTRKQVQSFLGFANFYRQFIPSFARVALPITDLLKTKHTLTKPRPGQLIPWTEECQKAFEQLKSLFAKEPVLKHPDPDLPFTVQADASDVAVGAVLLQKDETETLRPCAYTSRKLTPAERGWAIWEKEAFAVRWALLTWRHLLEGAKQPFIVWTDHKNLEALQTPRRLSPKQVRWAQYFQRFNFTLKYVPAGRNFLADALSRMPQYNSHREDIVQSIIPQQLPTAEAKRLDPLRALTDELRTALLNDRWLQDNRTLCTFRDGLAWRHEKLYVPASLRATVLCRCHDVKQAGHFGFLKTLHLVKRQFWWPRMRTDIEAYVKSCPRCAVTKTRPGRPLGLMQSVADPVQPWQEIAMDFIVDLPNSNGNTVIWTIIDLFSKQAHFIPCAGIPSARRLAKLFILHVYRLHGVPRRIISDRGVQFTAKFWREFIKLIGSTQGLSSAFHPSTNGAAERANAMVERYLRCYVTYQQTDWSSLLPFAEVAYNNTVHSSTGFTPFQVVNGMEFLAIPEWAPESQPQRTPREWAELIPKVWGVVKKALEKAADQYKSQANKKRADMKPLQVGDRVYLSTKYIKLRIPCKKLGPKYLGPFTIKRVINPVTVELQLPPLLGRIHPVFHSSLLKPVGEGDIRPIPEPPGPVVADHYEIDKVLDSRWHRGKLQYLVRWKGFPENEASWVLARDVNANRLLRRFHKRFPGMPGGD